MNKYAVGVLKIIIIFKGSVPGVPDSMRLYAYARAKDIYVRFAMVNLGLGNYSFGPFNSSLPN